MQKDHPDGQAEEASKWVKTHLASLLLFFARTKIVTRMAKTPANVPNVAKVCDPAGQGQKRRSGRVQLTSRMGSQRLQKDDIDVQISVMARNMRDT